jgi:excisionase family DNA binding protein
MAKSAATKRLTYTVVETAELLGVSRASAYRAINAGSIPAITIGRRLFVPRAALFRMLKNPVSISTTTEIGTECPLRA